MEEKYYRSEAEVMGALNRKGFNVQNWDKVEKVSKGGGGDEVNIKRQHVKNHPVLSRIEAGLTDAILPP